MPRIFPTVVRRPRVVVSPGGEISDQPLVAVQDPVSHPVPSEVAAAGPSVLETHPAPTTTESVARGVVDTSEVPLPDDGTTLLVAEHSRDTPPVPVDVNGLGLFDVEELSAPSALEWFGIGSDLEHPPPVPTSTLLVISTDPTASPAPVDRSSFGLGSLDAPPVPASAQRILPKWRPWALGVYQTALSGRTDWTNLGNAAGSNNSTFASLAGNATGARHGRLHLPFPDVPASWASEGLTIDSVSYLISFFRAAMAVTTLGQWTIDESTSAGDVRWYAPTTLQLASADDQSASGFVRIATAPAGGWTWAILNTFELRVETGTPAGNAATTHRVHRAQFRIDAHKDYN